jgi:hypothetical protein
MLDISNRITPVSLSHDKTIKKKVYDGRTIDGMANKTKHTMEHNKHASGRIRSRRINEFEAHLGNVRHCQTEKTSKQN